MSSLGWIGLLRLSHHGCDGCAARSDARHDCPGARTAVSPTVWALGFTSLLTDISSEMVNSILPVYLLLHLHLSPFSFGVVDGVSQAALAVTRLAGGIAGDRSGRHKRVAAAGYAVGAGCKLGILFAGGAWGWLVGVLALDRAGKGVRAAPRDAILSLASTPRSFATAFGVHRALDAAGALLGPVVAFGLMAFVPGQFDAIFVTSFVIALLGLGVLLCFVREPGSHDTGGQSITAPRPSAAALIGLAGFRRLAAAGLVLGLGTLSDGFVYLALRESAGLSLGLFPALYVGTALFGALLSVPAGRLADRRGRVPVFLAGHLLLLGLYLVLLGPAPLAGPGLALLPVALLGAYYAATDGVLPALAAGELPRELTGTGIAVATTASSLARLLSALAFGALWSRFGLRPALGGFVPALLAGLACAAWLLSPRAAARRGRPARPATR